MMMAALRLIVMTFSQGDEETLLDTFAPPSHCEISVML